MAPSYDFSGLLCAEDNSSFMFSDDDFDTVVVEQIEHHSPDQGDFLLGLPLQSEESLIALFEKECQYLPGEGYLKRFESGEIDISHRREALEWIGKVHAYYNFGPLCAYLAINYLDRFLTSNEIPKDQSWAMQLLAVSCLSLAAKIDETEVPLSVDLQIGNIEHKFEAKTIQTSEIRVLFSLNWKLQSVTPFSYLDYFLQKLTNDKPPSRLSISESIELILSTAKEIKFLEFRPSEVAAAVAIYATGVSRTEDFNKAITCLGFDDKVRVQRCFELINEMLLMGSSESHLGVGGSPQSPCGVLDSAFLGYKSEEEIMGLGSGENSEATSPVHKRMKKTKEYI